MTWETIDDLHQSEIIDDLQTAEQKYELGVI
jgi:hypothetical protein